MSISNSTVSLWPAPSSAVSITIPSVVPEVNVVLIPDNGVMNEEGTLEFSRVHVTVTSVK